MSKAIAPTAIEIEEGIFVEKNHGNYIISTMRDGQRISKTFVFYTLDEAIALFQQWIEEGLY
tara:strand:+ start:312 stop:497 length:186 start_codon:yes stop_codon:yes gene_type:complete